MGTGKEKTQLGSIPILEYSLEGEKGATVYFGSQTEGSQFDLTAGVSYAPNIITSRYIGEYLVVEGVYEMDLSRNFIIDTHYLYGNTKQTRHKKFHKVEVEAGKVTLISYFWKHNVDFGYDYVMYKNHKIVESNLAASYGPYLKYIKIQHNK
ncbi:MAG: hypothetical protein GX221_11675 [Candidatus Riflebacteria bacterium]|nr:hypothetical protein [Candidatus Riflebacteria bacterium]